MKKRLLLTTLMLTTAVLTACNQANSQPNNVQQPSAVTQQGGQTVTPINQDSLQNNQSSNSSVTVDSSSYIGEEKAMQIALEHAGVQQADLLFSYAEIEMDDGIWSYNVEFYAGNKEYDYEIDAVSGNILNFDFDMEGNFNPNTVQNSNVATDNAAGGTATNNTNTAGNQNTANANNNAPANAASASISLETARDTALSQVPGATVDHIRIYSDFDDGRPIYDGKIIYNNIEYDFEIDGTTGNITEWDAESIYD